MALTKAEMAELFLDVGLNKREAKEFVDAYFGDGSRSVGKTGNRSSCPVSAILICG